MPDAALWITLFSPEAEANLRTLFEREGVLPHPLPGFRVSGFGFRFSRVSGLVFRVSGFGFGVLGFWVRRMPLPHLGKRSGLQLFYFLEKLGHRFFPEGRRRHLNAFLEEGGALPQPSTLKSLFFVYESILGDI